MNLLLSLLVALNIGPVTADAPNRQPQLAASGSTVAMVFGSGHSIYLSTSHDSGRTFGAPAAIIDEPFIHLGRHRGPRVLFSGKTLVISAIAGKSADASELLVWRSTDGGATWSRPVRVNDVARAAREGLDSIAADSEGHLAAVWLDSRRPTGKQLYGAFSADGGATWSKNLLIYDSPDGTICQCCDPSVAATGPGEFAVMWRNAVGGNRDMYLTRVRDGRVSEPVRKLGAGSWKLDACPMDGGGIALDHGAIYTAWRRELTVYLTGPDNKEVALGNGKDVAIAAGAKGVYVAWADSSGIALHAPGEATPRRLSAAGSFPALLSLGDGTVLSVWEQSGSIQTRRLD